MVGRPADPLGNGTYLIPAPSSAFLSAVPNGWDTLAAQKLCPAGVSTPRETGNRVDARRASSFLLLSLPVLGDRQRAEDGRFKRQQHTPGCCSGSMTPKGKGGRRSSTHRSIPPLIVRLKDGAACKKKKQLTAQGFMQKIPIQRRTGFISLAID